MVYCNGKLMLICSITEKINKYISTLVLMY